MDDLCAELFSVFLEVAASHRSPPESRLSTECRGIREGKSQYSGTVTDVEESDVMKMFCSFHYDPDNKHFHISIAI